MTDRRLPLEDLLPSSCRWPHGARPPYLFCAAPVIEGLPYCEEHARLAYVDDPLRRRKRPGSRTVDPPATKDKFLPKHSTVLSSEFDQ